jgi:HEAT repeat protein
VTDPVARAAELATLGLTGTVDADAVARLSEACARDPDGRVRAAALAALVRAVPAAAVAAWHASTTDPDATVRRRAAELAPALDDPPGIAQLVELLADRDVTVVEAAAWALGELGDTAIARGAIGPLVGLVRAHRDPVAREAAVAALGALADPAALPAILDACTDRPAVRRRAVLALAPFEGPAVDAAITTALADKDWQVRQAAEDLQRSS